MPKSPSRITADLKSAIDRRATTFLLVMIAVTVSYLLSYALCVRIVYWDGDNYHHPVASYYCGPFRYNQVKVFFGPAQHLDEKLFRPKRWQSRLLDSSSPDYKNRNLPFERK